MNIIHLPIELLEERYSHQWYHWFDSYMNQNNINAINVLPNMGWNSKIENGQFLDVIKTNMFKAQQLVTVTQLVDEGRVNEQTVIFLMDAWFPGLEMLAYIRDAMKIPFKITGIFHAGTWDQHDYLTQCGMKSWGQFCERAWFEILDAIFVATNFHKKLIIENSTMIQKCNLNLTDKIHVTGLPIYPDFVKDVKKENIVVFPHRLAPEKQPELFDHLAKTLKDQFPHWQFIKTKDVCSTKQEYYDLLNRAKIAVSFAQQETFGISMIEATLCDCLPIVPNRLSYQELYPQNFQVFSSAPFCHSEVDLITTYTACMCQMFDEYQNCEKELKLYKDLQALRRYFIELGSRAIPNMFSIMESL